MNSRQKHLSLCVLTIAACAALLYNPSSGMAAVAPDLRSAANFAVLGGPAVTCTDSAIAGDVGVGRNTEFTNTRCTITGTVHAGDAIAFQAYTDFQSAYNALVNTQCDQIIAVDTFTDNLPALGPLAPGVYCFPAAATFTRTTLTLDGPSNGIWIFKIGTSGTGALTGTNFSVVMAGGGQPCNVYWWVAEAATMTTSNFLGTILAGAATTVKTGGSFIGRNFATAAVTLTGASALGCDELSSFSPCKVKKHKKHEKCNQGVGNGPEGCDHGNSNQGDDDNSNDELGGTPGNPGRKGGK